MVLAGVSTFKLHISVLMQFFLCGCRSSDKGVYRYRLIGIVEHSGTMRGGHYVAYVRGPVSGENRAEDVNPGSHTWFYISDSHVRQTSLESVLQSEAYLLFYEKCRIKDAGCASF
jgi:ubiquitin C-terminal hydrolase